MSQQTAVAILGAERPWPVSVGRWVQAQTWHDLLFAHYRVPVDAVRPHVPEQLRLDTYSGDAWLSVTPFWLSGVRPRSFPALPWFSTFPELNLRTYVTLDGKPGVYFFSLDAGNPLAVEFARLWYHLPYYRARMFHEWREGWMRYSSVRVDRRSPSVGFQAAYRPVGGVFRATPGSLDEWLTARYCLYASASGGRVYRADIHHLPWPLQEAEVDLRVNTLAAPLGLSLASQPDLIHFARHLDVLAWPPQLAIARDG